MHVKWVYDSLCTSYKNRCTCCKIHLCHFRSSLKFTGGMMVKLCSLLCGSVESNHSVKVWVGSRSPPLTGINFLLKGSCRTNLKLNVEGWGFPFFPSVEKFLKCIDLENPSLGAQLGFQQVFCFFSYCPSGLIVTQRNEAFPLRSSKVWK